MATLVLLTVGGVVTSSPAHAEACGAFNTLQTGWATNQSFTVQPQLYEGASAIITDRGGYSLCQNVPTIRNFSTSWAMVFSADRRGYAQSGTMYRATFGGCVKRWAQQANAGSFADFYIGGCSTVGESHRYWEQTLAVGDEWKVRSNIDQTIIHQSTFDPIVSWVKPFHVAFAGETTYPQSAIPGRAGLRQAYSTLMVQRYTDDSWTDACGQVILMAYNYNPNRWGTTSVSCNHIQTWTR